MVTAFFCFYISGTSAGIKTPVTATNVLIDGFTIQNCTNSSNTIGAAGLIYGSGSCIQNCINTCYTSTALHIRFDGNPGHLFEGGFNLSVNALNARYEIFSLVGILLKSGEKKAYSQDINLTGCSHGVYLLTLKVNGETVSKKLIF